MKKLFLIICLHSIFFSSFSQTEWFLGTNLGNALYRPIASEGWFLAPELRMVLKNNWAATMGAGYDKFQTKRFEDRQIRRYTNEGAFATLGIEYLFGGKENPAWIMAGRVTYSNAKETAQYYFSGNAFDGFGGSQSRNLQALSFEIANGKIWNISGVSKKIWLYTGLKNSFSTTWGMPKRETKPFSVFYVPGVGANPFGKLGGETDLEHIFSFMLELKLFYKF